MMIGPGQDFGFYLFGCIAVMVIGVLIVLIFFHITLMKAVQACSPRNQAMPPGLVWLNFVPFLNFVWQFVNVIQVGNSLQAEYRDRGLRSDGQSFGKTLGLSYIILGLVTNGIYVVGSQVAPYFDVRGEPGLGNDVRSGLGILLLVLPLVQLILWLSYWVKIAGFTRELNSSPRRSQYDDEGDRDYDPGRDARDDGDRPRDRD